MTKPAKADLTSVTPLTPPALHPMAPTPPDTIEHTLRERGVTHGDFADVAHYAQLMKDILRTSKGYPRMNDAQREAVEAWLCKTARIMAGGDVSFPDHAHDVAGYAQLYVRACPRRTVEQAVAKEVARAYGVDDVSIALEEKGTNK